MVLWPGLLKEKNNTTMQKLYKDKSKLNLSIDMIMLLLLLPVAGIGFLIKYVLIPGIQRNSIYGNNTDLEFWGLTRHQWGTIHLVLSIVFLVLLVLHIALHWKMITCVYPRMIPHKTTRAVFTISFTAIGLLLIAFPLIIKPEVVRREPLHQNRKEKNISVLSGTDDTDSISYGLINRNKPGAQTRNNSDHENALKEDYEVQGSMTLQYVAEKYNVPVSKIAADLNIPEKDKDEQLGRLRKQYGFTMNDVRSSIAKNKR